MVKYNCQNCGFEGDYTGSKKLDVTYSVYISCSKCRTSIKINKKQQIKKK